MNIKEIIDRERVALERIEAAVLKRIAELEDTIGRYEAELLNINHVCISNFPDKCSGQKLSVALEECIAELKEQMPKLVTPKPIGKDGLGFEMYQCGCNSTLRGVENYCPECGSKLNWEEA